MLTGDMLLFFSFLFLKLEFDKVLTVKYQGMAFSWLYSTKEYPYNASVMFPRRTQSMNLSIDQNQYQSKSIDNN